MKDARARSLRRHRFLVALPVVATAVVIAATVATVPDVAGGREPAVIVWLAVLGMFLIPYTTVGALIEDRRPGQVVGRICLTIGVLLGVSGLLLVASATVDSLSRQEPTPLAAALRLVGSSIIALVFLLSEPLLVSRFPDGREPGRTGVLVDGLLAVAGAFMLPVLLLGGLGLANDVGVATTLFVSVTLLAYVLASILACVGLARRYIRGSSIVRAQIRWFAAAIGASIVFFVLFALVYLATFLFPTAFNLDDLWVVGAILAVVWLLSLLLPPLAIGAAILRHHLYDIDRIVGNAIGYGLVSLVLIGVFTVVNLGLQGALSPLTGENPLAVAASTLIVAVSFNPLRVRVQRVIDRRFHRARYDAERTVAVLAGRLRDEVDIARLRHEILEVVERSVEPTEVHLWLRPGSAR